MPSLARLSKLGLAYYGVLIIAVVVGLLIGGGTGTTITAIAAILLALTIMAAYGGVGIAARDGVDRRGRRGGRPLDDEDERPQD